MSTGTYLVLVGGFVIMAIVALICGTVVSIEQTQQVCQ